MKHIPRTGWPAVLRGSRPRRCVPGALLLGGLFFIPVAATHAADLSAPAAVASRLMLFNQQGYLGVDLGAVDSEHAGTLHLTDTHAAEVTMLDHDAPAAKSGIRTHDVILQLDGRPFATVEQLRHRLHEMPAGRTITLLISRDGNRFTFILTLCDQSKLQQQAWSQHISVPAPSNAIAGETANYPGAEGIAASSATRPAAGQSFMAKSTAAGPAFLASVLPKSLYVGADVNPVHTQLADYFGVTSGTGLLVINVDSQSPAARAGMRAGDVIVRVESEPMKTRADWLKSLRKHHGRPVVVTVMRNKQELNLALIAGRSK